MAYLQVEATLADYDEWKSDFEGYNEARAERGGQSYQLFRAIDDPNEVVVLIEFDDEESAHSWVEYLQDEEELGEPEMSEVAISYLEFVEQEQL